MAGAAPYAAALIVFGTHSNLQAQTLEDLGGMSIDELAQVNVSSVSKSDQPLGDAPAAIYVISHEDIVRSGAASIPEMLRLAPNLQVAQQTPAKWVVYARGLSGSPAAQNFANKLLVLVDGRAVYTPLFSGVYWDMPDVLPDNVDRIEVISGPGATLWGSNAVNGVINIITRSSAETGGVYADLRAGPDRQVGGLRFGGSLGEQATFRAHVRAMREDAFQTAAGLSAEDEWGRIGGGFRFDWTPSAADQVSLIGELSGGRLEQPGTAREEIATRNLTLRWNRRTSETGELQVQAYYDRIERDDRATGGGDFHVDTYDAEIQHSWLIGGRHRLVAGGGVRMATFEINGTPSLFFVPAEDDLFIANAFVQDSFSLTSALTVTGGMKVERLPYAGTSLLPEFRLAWKPTATTLLWGAVSRAVRSPTPFDVTVQERADPIFLSGNPQFRTEKLTAFELGARAQPARSVSFSATAFYHLYDDLRTIELVPGPGLSLAWGNGIEGASYGLEVWADWRPTSWWTLSAGGMVLDQDFRFKPGASGILGLSQLGSDRPYTAKLRSSMNLRPDLTLDLDFRAAGALPDPAVPAFQELGGRLAWETTPGVTLSVTGTNLLNDTHQEYPGGDLIPRRVMAGLELAL